MSTEDETRAERAPPVAAKGRKWSNYAGVSWSSQNTPAWRTHVWDPQTELLQQVGSYASEEDAARAYDRAAVKIHGPGAELNFLGETPGEQQQQQMSSRYIGVRWIKSSAKWCAELRDRSAKRTRRQYLGSFVSEADAARAYDHATVRAHGPGVQRNFPGEPLPAVCEEPRQQRGSSRYLGVSWDKCGSAWRVCVYDGQTRRPQNVGRYASEEDAARAYDFAAVQQRGKGTERNFPGEDISELPVAVERRKQPRGSSCFLGVSWDKFHSAWHASMWDQQTKCSQHIGRYASKEDAARAYDFAVVQARGPGTERNFPGEEISEPPVEAERREQQQSTGSSLHLGVGQHEGSSAWLVRHVGSYASEEDAARAHDGAAVKSLGPAQRNFPDEASAISGGAALPVSSSHLGGGCDAAPGAVTAAPGTAATMVALPVILARVVCVWPLASLPTSTLPGHQPHHFGAPPGHQSH